MELLQGSAGQISSLLELAGDDQPELSRSRLDAFQLAVVLTVVAELLARRILSPGSALADGSGGVGTVPVSTPDLLLTLAFSICLGLLFLGRWRRESGLVAAGLAAFAALWYLPETANHTFLMAFCLFFPAMIRRDEPAERELALQALRWCWLIVFFSSGVQKLIYGLYLRGELLTYMIAHEETFAAMFGVLMPVDELDRIRSLVETGGPYVSEWMPLALMSNMVWIFEIVAPAFLLYRPTRSITALLTLLFVVAIEIGARELFFGFMAVNLTLLFLHGDWIRRLLPVYAVSFVLLLLVEAGILWPGFQFF